MGGAESHQMPVLSVTIYEHRTDSLVVDVR
jgi:hypothetical protein